MIKLFNEKDQKEIRLGIAHIESSGRRGTKVWLETFGFKESAVALCSPEDNFCKKTGRRLAAIRLLDKLQCYCSSYFDKKLRRKIFEAICPEYSA